MELASPGRGDHEILERFRQAPLPDEIVGALEVILQTIQGPLAVRSSSLLEDDMLHPFAGIYGTVMIPNLATDRARRLRDLSDAIKTVYATAFFANARAYLDNTDHRIEEERMAVIIQRVVGRRHADVFYPDLAGVAHSFNYYPLGPLKAEDGVVQMVLGLGRMVVDGGQALRFCPRHPEVLPQFASPKLVLKNSQKQFYALDLNQPWREPEAGFSGNQVLCDLKQATDDGTFRAVGSIYDAQNDRITENLLQPGARVVTFNNILKHQTIPLAPALAELLDIITEGMGMPVELEFACDMADWSQPSGRGRPTAPPVFYPLQVRPILTRHTLHEIQPEQFNPDQIICRSTQALGHGTFHEIQDVVYVKPDAFDPAHTPTIAQEVDRINASLLREKRPYILIGPGRWGSADHWLGIPVQWSQISQARIIIEASREGYNVDPSQGTHFFHNITGLGLGYFTIPPGAAKNNPRNHSFVDWEWLEAQASKTETTYLRHITPSQPLVAYLDGHNSLGLIAWCTQADLPCRES